MRSLVPTLFAYVPRCGGDRGRAESLCRSCHHLALGSALCSYIESAASPRSAVPESLLARGRNLRQGRRQLGILVSGCRFRRRNDRVYVIAEARLDRRKIISAARIVRRRAEAASDQR